MSTTYVLLIALALLIYAAYSKLSKRLQEQRSSTDVVLLSLAEQIERLRDEITVLKSTLEEAAMLSEAEKYERRERKAFDQAEALTLANLRQLKPGAALRLMSCSWYYPSKFPVFGHFEYKHDHIDEQNP